MGRLAKLEFLGKCDFWGASEGETPPEPKKWPKRTLLETESLILISEARNPFFGSRLHN